MDKSILKKAIICFAGVVGFLVSSCAMDDERLVGRWTLVSTLTCPDYHTQTPEKNISMLRFNQNGDWAMSYDDGQLIFNGTYTAKPEADGMTDFSAELSLLVENGPADLSPYSFKGTYSVSENYLTLHGIWLHTNNTPKGCGYSFKRR